MKLPELCIRQPVLATVLSLVLIVLGLIAFKRLEIRFFPEIKIPVVTISTSYPGASAKLVETQITTPIENAIASVGGIQYISSSSSGGASTITVMFEIGSNFESEAAQIRDKVVAAEQNLPTTASPPSVVVGTQGNVVIQYGITQTGKNSSQIRDYVTHNIQPLFTQLKGVGSVFTNGAWDYALRVWLNASKMAALGITVDDVRNALQSNNIYFAAGSFLGDSINYGVITQTQLTTPDQFKNIILKNNPNGVIHLQDVADVNQGYTTPFPTDLFLNGKQGVVLNVQPLQDANPIEVANEAKAVMKNVQASLPSGMKTFVIYDESTFLQDSINETFYAIGEAVLLVMLVVCVFLGSWRAASIPIVTIPVSMITVFFILYLLGFSINTLSLLAMVLAIGLVVDDAIVMLENIHRHLEQGASPWDAALLGSQEIMSAVIAMSITLAAVYAPVGLAQGFTAQLFQQFAFTLAGAVLISGFVALTLSPMMCSKILRPESRETRYVIWLDHTSHRLTEWYKIKLKNILQKKGRVVWIMVVLAGLGAWLFSSMASEFLPPEDYGAIAMAERSPSGATPQYVARYLNQIESVIKGDTDIANYGYQLMWGNIISFFTLKPWQERHQTVQQIVDQLNTQFAKITGLTITASVPPMINYGNSAAGLQIDLMTTGDYDDLLLPVHKLETILKNYPGLFNVDTDLRYDTEEYALTINRDLASATGVSLQDIADTIQAMMSGGHWTDVQSGVNTYPVMVQMRKQDMLGFGSLDKLYVRSSNVTNAVAGSDMIPLSSLVTLKPIVDQGTLDHYNRLRAASVTAQLYPGYTMSDLVKYIESHMGEVVTPKIQYAYIGEAQQFIRSSNDVLEIFALALIFIYLVLSAQFGSFIDPFVILFAVPFSMVGAILFLKIAGGTLNLYSEIGLVTLVGMISKHGILITQFINDLRAKGIDIVDAIAEGAAVRLRPILMTTFAMFFGALPLAFAYGPGSNGRSQIGWVIMGGLLCGTFFSLIVVPVAYAYLGKFKKIKSDAK